MALTNSFANQATDFPSQLDRNFSQVGAMGIVACTANGNNAINLSPLGGQTTVSQYQNYELFGFVAAATCTGPVTISVANLQPQILVLADASTQATAGSIRGGVYYIVAYNTALNGGLGGMQLLTQMPVSSMLDLLSSAQGAILFRGSSGWVGLAAGQAGNLLQSQSNSVAWVNPGTKASKQLIFQNAGAFSFSASSGIASSTVVKITLVGGGGGGGGGIAGRTVTSGAGGGGSGAIAIGFISGLTANTLYSGRVGAGGTGGSGGHSSGPPGADSGQTGAAGTLTTVSFGGVQFTAGGGTGGGGATGEGSQSSAISGGSGGSATNATILIPGGNGCSGGLLGNKGVVAGQGGRGYWGGGAAVFGGFMSSQGPNSPGAGGSGGASNTNGNSDGHSGTNGRNGIFLMEWIE